MNEDMHPDFIWKVMINGNIQTAYYVAADSREEAIEIATYLTGLPYNCAVVEEDY